MRVFHKFQIFDAISGYEIIADYGLYKVINPITYITKVAFDTLRVKIERQNFLTIPKYTYRSV